MDQTRDAEAVAATDEQIAREFVEILTTEAALEMMIDNAATAEDRTFLAGLILASSRSDASTIATLRRALERAEGAIRDVQEFQTIMGDNHERGLQHCRCVPAIRRTLSAALDEKGE